MAKVIVNKRANIYHDNGNNKVEFEDNLYRILSRDREYVKQLLNGEKFYPDVPQPIPTGYIYPTSYSDNDWAELMTEPYSTEHTYPVSFTQEGNVVTLDVSSFFGYEIQPCVAVINCDIGDTEGVTLSAKLTGMIPAFVNQKETWSNIANAFSAELVLYGDGMGSGESTLTFTTDEDVTVNSITVYYTQSTPPEPPAPDYYTADSTTDANSILTPLDTPTTETEAEETAVTGWAQEGYVHYISASGASTGAVGGYVMFDVDLGEDNYKLLAQGVNENAYTYGNQSSQIFTPDNYTVTVSTNATGSYVIGAVDGDNQNVTITINSVVKYYNQTAPEYITAHDVDDDTNSLAPLVTPTEETEAEEHDALDRFSQSGNNVQANIYDVTVSESGGYLLLDVSVGGDSYTLLAQSIYAQSYTYGAAIHQYFTAGNYTVDVSGEETYDSPHLIISATDIDSLPVEVTLTSAKLYFGEH